MKLPRPRSGFTLIELLIVVAIIGILAALVSSAIMKLTKTAANKRNVNNAERLEAAIVEYWHDMGRWPIPKKGLTITPGKGTGLAGSSDEGKDVDTYSYTTAFKANNNEIVEKLINATLPDGTQKTFLDLHGFSTPIDASGDGPYEDVVDAYLAYTGDARKPDGSTFTKPPSCISLTAIPISSKWASSMIRGAPSLPHFFSRITVPTPSTVAESKYFSTSGRSSRAARFS